MERPQAHWHYSLLVLRVVALAAAEPPPRRRRSVRLLARLARRAPTRIMIV